jgi:hypothetical protein
VGEVQPIRVKLDPGSEITGIAVVTDEDGNKPTRVLCPFELTRPLNRGQGAQPVPPVVTNGSSIHANAMLRRLARHRACSIAALIERWAQSAERRTTARLSSRALKTYYGD